MAVTLLTRRRQVLRSTGQRLLEEHRALAGAIGRLFLQAATGRSETGERIIPNRRSTRDGLMAAIYAQVLKPYYVGGGEEPFAGTRPLSPYAQLLYDGVRSMIQLEAERQAALVRRLSSDPVVTDWLLRPGQVRRPVQEMSVGNPLGAFTQWLDPRGFRLVERIQRVAIEVRSRVARFVDYHIGSGTPAPTMATKVEDFLTTGERGNTTYGNQGAVAPRVLVQHEMVRAGGDAVAGGSAINPFVRGAQWLLDPAHPKPDRCDTRARGGPNGDGVYPLTELPPYPDHINCMCHLRSVPVPNPAAVTRAVRAEIDRQAPAANALRGALNPERLAGEVLTGDVQRTVDQVQQAAEAERLRQEKEDQIEWERYQARQAALQAEKARQTEVTIRGEPAVLRRAGISQERLVRLFDIGPDARANVLIEDLGQDGIAISGGWFDKTTGDTIGTVVRSLYPDDRRAEMHELAFDEKYLNQGLGMRVARGWYDALTDANYERAELYAGLSVGRYAWAKEGAEYADPNFAREITGRFRQWVTRRGLNLAPDEFPLFERAFDVATYRHPRYTLTGREITNISVPDDMVLPLGKAFMLDQEPYGHGSWEGYFDLTRRRGQ